VALIVEEGEPGVADREKVLRSFVDGDGRIVTIPVKRSRRRVLLEWLVEDFRFDERYSESMVNLVIGKRHADTAALRRYLIEERLMQRADGRYWRVQPIVDGASEQ
jgi:hypothetical protein